MRETLFNVLGAGNAAAFEGKVWLDLCAGTGAVGIEALSRGAAKVYFVESSTAAAALIRRNLDSLKVAEGFEVVKEDAARALRTLRSEQVTASLHLSRSPLPHGEALSVKFSSCCRNPALLGPDTVVVAEHDKRFDPGDGFAPLQRYRKLEQGDAALSFYRLAPMSREALPPAKRTAMVLCRSSIA